MKSLLLSFCLILGNQLFAQVEADVQLISANYSDHFKKTEISNAQLDKIVSFMKHAAGTESFQQALDRISNFGDQKFNELKSILKEQNVSHDDLILTIYKNNGKRENYFCFWGGDRHPLAGKLSTQVAREFCSSGSEFWRLGFLDESDFTKYAAFFEDKMISNVVLLKHLLDTWDEYETIKFQNSGTNKYLKEKGMLSDIDKMLSNLARHFPWYSFQENYELESKSPFEQLFIAAYNDIYFDLRVSGWKGSPDGEIDVRSFDLTKEQLKVVQALLDMNESVTQTGLQRAFLDQNFDDFQTERSFKLACYLAFHQKFEKMDRDWNHAEFYTNPFVSGKELQTIPIFAIGTEELNESRKVINTIIETVDFKGGNYCFTSFSESMYSIAPKLNSSYDYTIFQALSSLNTINMNTNFVRITTTTGKREIMDENEFPREDITIDYPPAPPVSSTPTVVFRDNLKLESQIVEFPEVEASFPGGEGVMMAWINKTMVYPSISRELGDQGRVFVTFIVETDGSIFEVEIMNGGVTNELNREAKRIVKRMPFWSPAEKDGKPVRSRQQLPISFTL